VKVTVKAGTTMTSSTTTSSTTSSTTTSTTIDESLPYDDSQGGAGGSAQDPPRAAPPSGGSEPVDVRPLLIGAIVAVSALIVLILTARAVRTWHDRRLSAAGID
jgi:hypothetical protein